jgi:AcrR family transcriptional regulator
MMIMSISYVESGRREQKGRTRSGLIAAARDLLARGITPTVEQAAAAASISRATAYRYFPNRHELLVAAHPEADATSLLGPNPPADPEARLDVTVSALAKLLLDGEASYRAMLRLALEPDAPLRDEVELRRGLRFVWIADALAPVRDRFSPDEFERLVHSIGVVTWVEALVTLVDLAGFSRARAVKLMRWSARGLLRTALADDVM